MPRMSTLAPTGHPSPPDQSALILQVLSLEYQTLRADMIARSSARFQFLGFVVAAAAIIAAAIGAAGDNGVHPAVWYVGIGVLAFSLASFWMLGRDQARLSAKVAELEARINDLVPGNRLLLWESAHQKRSAFEQWVLGIRPSGDKRGLL
jgi:hypothetical protein